MAKTNHQWSHVVGVPEDGTPPFSMETRQHDGIQTKPVHRHIAETEGLAHERNPRLLFAAEFWGHRRFSDPILLQSHGLTTQALRALNLQNGDDSNGNGNGDGKGYDTSNAFSTPSPTPPSKPQPRPTTPTTPGKGIAIQLPQRPTPPPPTSPGPPHRSLPPSPTIALHSSSASLPAPAPQRPPFLHCPGYNPHALALRTPFPLPTRREELVDALAQVEIHPVKGLGSIARPAINKSHSSKLLAHFLHHAQRSLLVPVTAAEPAPSLTPIPPVAAARVAAAVAVSASVTTVPDPLSQRDLGILESELFDTAKYVGGSRTHHLTVLTWCEDDQYGSITLFEVDVDEPPLPDLRRAATGLAARRRRAPPALLNSHSAGGGRVTGLRPVAAMEDVPRQVLVNMRVDYGLKKAVLQYGKETGRFRWTAQHTRRGQPRFARVWGVDGVDGGCELEVHSATAAGFEEGCCCGRSTMSRKARRKDARWRERRLLRVEDARDTHCRHGGRVVEPLDHLMQADDGIVATIPQFLALLHGSRSTIEKVTSSPATARSVETKDGERVRAVSLGTAPLKGTRHKGKEIHVVVLVPDGAKWAENRIFWTDDGAGVMAELRLKKYRDVIDSESGQARRGRGHVHHRDWDARSWSSPSLRAPSLSPGPRTARW